MSERVPFTFLSEYAGDLKTKYSLHIAGNPEDQLKTPVSQLLQSLGEYLRLDIETKTESPVEDIGRPDIAVARSGLLVGHVELKAPGKGADVRKFFGRDKEQSQRFRALPNLIYTDGTDWSLYRSGDRVSRVKLAGDLTQEGSAELTKGDGDKLLALVSSFLSWTPVVPNTAKGLAELLAPLCHLARDEVLLALEDKGSALSTLKREWQEYLFPDVDDRQFADAYAQTLTYALLLARVSGETDLNVDTAEKRLRNKHSLLAQVLRLLTQPSARNEISLSVDVLERVIGAVDPIEPMKDGGDPWLYFYEDFLAAYDNRLRNDRGVYYTPVNVVRAQVRLVGDLLVNKMEKSLAYASNDVTLLDPAAGTGTYPLAAIQYGIDLAIERFGPGEAASTAAMLGRNIHAFEILVGPYAVAHLRLTERILDAGGSLPADGVHVYLTDTLDSPNEDQPRQLTLSSKALVDEHKRALAVKRDTRILVCIGNPPYDRQQIDPGDDATIRKGGWIRRGDPGEPISNAPLESFLQPARESGQGKHLKNLYNDYVYFWRWALWKVLELSAGPGIISFITASSYLRGPGFIGMREVMRRTFDDLWIIDLEGDNRGPRKTENVFDIETPVAIAIGARFGKPNADHPARVHYTKIEGSRESKLEALGSLNSMADLEWSDCLEGWQEPFLPTGTGDFFSWPLLVDLFPWQHSGVQMKRTWPIGETPEVLKDRWEALLTSSARARLFRETGDRVVTRTYSDLDTSAKHLPPISSLPINEPLPEIVRYGFRSFDRQWIFKDGRVGDRMRPQLWDCISNRQIFMAGLLGNTLGNGPAATVSADVPDMHYFNGRGGKDIIPLWRNREATEPNITQSLLEYLGRLLSSSVQPDQLFAYCYALLASPSYAQRFSEELTISGPRIPLTKDAKLFKEAAQLGQRLICLHTFGSRMCGTHITDSVPRGRARSVKGIPSAPSGYPEEYFYNPATETLHIGSGEIAPVKPDIWKYSVSGLQVVKSWISYRLKERAGRTSSDLDNIRPRSWTLQMTGELLELIWVLEATVDLEPELKDLLSRITQSEVFASSELPQPSEDQCDPPSRKPRNAGPRQKRMF